MKLLEEAPREVVVEGLSTAGAAPGGACPPSSTVEGTLPLARRELRLTMALEGNGNRMGRADEHPSLGRRPSRIDGHEGRARPRTVAAKRLSREEKRLALLVEYPEDAQRPTTRGQCQSMLRPCPFVSCAYHLYLDVNPKIGSLKFNFPDLEVWQLQDTCVLDVADRGPATLEQVGHTLNVTRERTRQIEEQALAKLNDPSKPNPLSPWLPSDGIRAPDRAESPHPRAAGSRPQKSR